jgi:hypothetical protein
MIVRVYIVPLMPTKVSVSPTLVSPGHAWLKCHAEMQNWLPPADAAPESAMSVGPLQGPWGEQTARQVRASRQP